MPEPGDIILSAPDGQEVCDFCLGGPITWSYPARDFSINADPRAQLNGSLGDWAACDACSVLVEVEDTKALADKSVAAQMKNRLASFFGEVLIREHTERMLFGFFANRAGPRETEAEYRKRHGKRGVV